MTLLIGKDPNAGKDWRQKRRGWQRMRWLYSITISMDMVLSKLWEMVKDRETWPAASPWGHKELDVTERLNNSHNTCMKWVWNSYPHSNPQCNWVKPALTDQTNINGVLTMCSENTNTTKTQILPSNYCLVQATITLIPKPDKDTTHQTRKLQAVSPMNIDAKSSTKH